MYLKLLLTKTKKYNNNKTFTYMYNLLLKQKTRKKQH